ncbi:hypothetical protein NDU88_004520 [Pleurodeles waltl]|uniref:Uncharacterized protein n=1 Tax=Pleurodeles waltl TaxID=8319 RepID=A0AAV7WS38_PLEWA|nr:hypothetical protein NDU88_004520 [Pleurodeles waltl]
MKLLLSPQTPYRGPPSLGCWLSVMGRMESPEQAKNEAEMDWQGPDGAATPATQATDTHRHNITCSGPLTWDPSS